MDTGEEEEEETIRLRPLVTTKRESANNTLRMENVEVEVEEEAAEAEAVEVVVAVEVGEVEEEVTNIKTTKDIDLKVAIKAETLKKLKMQDLSKPKASNMAAKIKGNLRKIKVLELTTRTKETSNRNRSRKIRSRNKMIHPLIRTLLPT